ncbi:MAG: hypothetical protein VB108_09945 [Anaerolineaceae bacterium]|nr:hypothetical protein [Anaerolineaceae bacterium]
MNQKPDEIRDDDFVVCDMNVPGMPWHDRQFRKGSYPAQGDARYGGERITKGEQRRYTWYAVLAGLTVVLIFAIVWVLFTLFATQIWFR